MFYDFEFNFEYTCNIYLLNGVKKIKKYFSFFYYRFFNYLLDIVRIEDAFDFTTICVFIILDNL